MKRQMAPKRRKVAYKREIGSHRRTIVGRQSKTLETGENTEVLSKEQLLWSGGPVAMFLVSLRPCNGCTFGVMEVELLHAYALMCQF